MQMVTTSKSWVIVFKFYRCILEKSLKKTDNKGIMVYSDLSNSLEIYIFFY